MIPGAYDNGDLVKCSVVFRDSAGTAIDPTTVKCAIRDPEGTILDYTYGTDQELIREGVGQYRVDVSVEKNGCWFYRFYSEGIGQAAAESIFFVTGGL